MLKWMSVTSLVIVISFWHLRGSHLALEGHLLHQELFFIPIILASFWFRLPTGIVIAIVVSGVYLSSMIPHFTIPGVRIAVFTQIALYVFIAALIGWLTSRLHKQQLQIIKDEQRSSLAKLASALSSEIQEIVHSLEIKYKVAGKQEEPKGLDIKQEIDKLERITNAFTQLGPPGSNDIISKDLNEIVKNTQRKYRQRAKGSQVNIKLDLDEAGCPSMVITEGIVQLYEALVVNAIEASPKGAEVILRTIRKGAHCLLEVADKGSGVLEKDVAKLFRPFFTTKIDGHGLSLAAGKKIMRDYEGDLLYEHGKDGGAVFRMVVPKENKARNIDTLISEKIHPLAD